jgi:murein DD-endopeptidase MepM/ murein hydrolase activator NlpD
MGFSFKIVGLALLLATMAASISCDLVPRDDAELTHAEYSARLERADLEMTRLGAAWLGAAQDSLEHPATVGLPHHESGVFFPHEARAAVFALDAVENQVLRLSVSRGSESTGRLFIDVFRSADSGEGFEPVYEARDGEDVEVVLEQPGRYVIRLQPELLATIVYDLRIELEASFAFPVSGIDSRAVQSFFGDPRDAGRRRHEGIDIFAARSTPVIAVADGTASARTNRLGGNTVWLRTDAARFYYAHLERAAFEGSKRVVAGEVLGYVGNTGNARTTPPHLHFGMYRTFAGAQDPVPYLQSQRLEVSTPSRLDAHYIETTASALNLRAAPRIDGENVVTTLPANTIARAVARSGRWLRVRTVEGDEGWIYDEFQRPLPGTGTIEPKAPSLVYSDAEALGTPVGIAAPLDTLQVFARHETSVLVGQHERGPIGWLRL